MAKGTIYTRLLPEAPFLSRESNRLTWTYSAVFDHYKTGFTSVKEPGKFFGFCFLPCIVLSILLASFYVSCELH